MRTSFDNDSFSEDDDLVGVLDRGKSVSDDDDSLTELTVGQDAVQGLLDCVLGLSVQRTCCLVKEEDLGLANESTGDGDSLLLSARQLHASFSNQGIISLRKDALILKECVCACLFACFIQLFWSGWGWKSILDIVTNRAGEEDWLLLDNSHVLLEAFWIQRLEILSTIFHISDLWIVESLNKLNDG